MRQELPCKPGAQLILGFLLAFFVCQTFGTVIAQDAFYRLETVKIFCIKENLERYLNSPGDEYFINVSKCPDIPGDPWSEVFFNASPDIDFSDDDKVDRLIVVTHEQLQCLVSSPTVATIPVHRFFPDSCRLEPESE